MSDPVRERIFVVLAAGPFAFVLSVIMRVVAELCHKKTPGWLFVDWFVPLFGTPISLSGPALYYLILVDLGFCWLVVLCVYWFLYKHYYDV